MAKLASALRVISPVVAFTAVVNSSPVPWPASTVASAFFGYLLGGAVIVEVLFSIPGVGLYTFNALNNRDYGVVQAGVMISAVVFIALNTIVDILYALIDPRVARRMDAKQQGPKQ